MMGGWCKVEWGGVGESTVGQRGRVPLDMDGIRKFFNGCSSPTLPWVPQANS